MRWLILLFWLLTMSAIGHAAVLSEYSCARPKPLDSGSWENVSLAASALNGLIIQPGEQFSFLKALSPVQIE